MIKNKLNLIATYAMILAYKNQPSNYWLALSEFIDNSISSFTEGGNDSVEGLKIDINIDFSDEKNWKITIKDNAKGMSQEELLNNMQPHSKTGKKDTDYNQYGVGMKFAIFWFGANGIIYSKKKDKKTYCVDFTTENKNPDSAVILESVESNEKNIENFGTIIQISNIYKNKNIASKGKLKLTKEALGWRYNKLISEGLEISISMKMPDERSSLHNPGTIIKKFEIEPFTLQNFIKSTKTSINSKKISEKKEQIEKEIINLEEFINDINNKKDSKINSKKLKLKAYTKFLNNEEMKFTKKIFLNNNYVDLKFGILMNTPKNRYSGLTTYHKKRAINHGPNDNDDGTSGGTIQFLDKSKGSAGEATWRWLYGEINLTGIEAPDQNKSKFIWSCNDDDQDDIKKKISTYDMLIFELKDIWKTFEELLQIIVDIKLFKDVPEMSEKKDFESVIIDVKHKTPCNLSVKEDSNGKCYINAELKSNYRESLLLGGENLIFNVFENDQLGNNFLLSDKTEDNKEFNIYFNPNHEFWKPIFQPGDKKIRGGIIYPIIIAIVVTNELNKKENTMNLDSTNTFIEIMNKVLSTIGNN